MMRSLSLVGLFISTTALAAPTHDTLLATFEAPQDYPSARDRVVADLSLDKAELDRALADSRWEVRLQAELVQIWRADPERAALCWESDPGLTRKGTPRFAGEIWRGPDSAPLLLERLVQADESAELRGALVGALSHTDGDWTQAISSLFELEADASVREVMADVLRHGEASFAWTGLSQAAADPDAAVRAAAMRSIGSRDDGIQGAALLSSAMSDSDATVQAMAARSSGILQISDAWDPIRALLDHSDASVRLNALRALSRIDADRAAQLTELARLRTDKDSKVQRLAERIAQP
jgi:hypothetical protein